MQVIDELFVDRRFGLFAEPKRVRDGLRDEAGIVDRRQFDDPCAIAEAPDDIGGELEREAGFADATGAHDRN